MPDNIAINRVTNAKVYLKANSLLGKVEECELPSLKAVMGEHKALGMFGKIEFFDGLDLMETKFKWTALYPEVLRELGNLTQTLPVQVRASMTRFTGQGIAVEVPVVVMMTIATKELPLGKFASKEPVTLESTHTVYYIKETIDGEDVLEIDVLANIYKVNGVDLLAQYRANLGE